MKKMFELNGNKYVAKEITFNAVCELEDMGISLMSADSKQLSVLRGYIAYCCGLSVEDAGKEIEKHLIGGNDLSDIAKAFANAIDESDFFQALRKGTKTEIPKSAEQE